MRPHFTDQYRYLRGYVRAEFTDISKTWAAARSSLEQDRKQPQPKSNVLQLKVHGTT